KRQVLIRRPRDLPSSQGRRPRRGSQSPPPKSEIERIPTDPLETHRVPISPVALKSFGSAHVRFWLKSPASSHRRRLRYGEGWIRTSGATKAYVGGIRPELGALLRAIRASVLERVCSPGIRLCWDLSGSIRSQGGCSESGRRRT